MHLKSYFCLVIVFIRIQQSVFFLSELFCVKSAESHCRSCADESYSVLWFKIRYCSMIEMGRTHLYVKPVLKRKCLMDADTLWWFRNFQFVSERFILIEKLPKTYFFKKKKSPNNNNNYKPFSVLWHLL